MREKLALQNDIDRYRSELTLGEDNKRNLERRASEKTDEVQQLHQRLEDISGELDSIKSEKTRKRLVWAHHTLINAHFT